MKILVTGRKGKLAAAVAGALRSGSGTEVVAVPVGSQLLEMARAVKSLVFALGTEEELEPLRWVLQQNRSLAVVAVLWRRDANLEMQLREEGVAEWICAQGLTAAQLRQELAKALAKTRAGRAGQPRAGRQAAAEFHAIRSHLTAILGNAELALKNARSLGQKHQLQEIARGVAAIERTLRRLERALPVSKL